MRALLIPAFGPVLQGLPGNALATRQLGIQIARTTVLRGFDAASGEQPPNPVDRARELLATNASARSDRTRD